jgi:hypothetical protein
MTAESIKGRIETELRKAMERLGGDPRASLEYAAFAQAGASPELLAIVGSIGDTLTDEQVLDFLSELNAGRPFIRDGLSAELSPDELAG